MALVVFMFGWLFVSRREFLAMVSRLDSAFAALEAKIDAEHEEVQEKVSALVAEIEGLKDQVQAGLDSGAIADRLDLLAGKVELIYVPEAVVAPEAVAESVYEVEEDPAEDVPDVAEDLEEAIARTAE